MEKVLLITIVALCAIGNGMAGNKSDAGRKTEIAQESQMTEAEKIQSVLKKVMDANSLSSKIEELEVHNVLLTGSGIVSFNITSQYKDPPLYIKIASVMAKLLKGIGIIYLGAGLLHKMESSCMSIPLWGIGLLSTALGIWCTHKQFSYYNDIQQSIHLNMIQYSFKKNSMYYPASSQWYVRISDLDQYLETPKVS